MERRRIGGSCADRTLGGGDGLKRGHREEGTPGGRDAVRTGRREEGTP